MADKAAQAAVAEMLADISDGVNEPNAIETEVLSVENIGQGDETPVVSQDTTPETPETPEPAEIPEAVDEGLISFAKKAQQLMERGGISAVIEELYRQSPGEEQRKFIDSLTKDVKTTSAKSMELPPDYEPQGELEQVLLPFVNDVKALPELKTQVADAFQTHATFINEGHIRTRVLEAQVQALADMVEAKFPQADIPAMMKAVASGKSYDDVAKTYDTKKAVELVKQAKKARPIPSGQGSNDTMPAFKPGTSMVDMLRVSKANGAIR